MPLPARLRSGAGPVLAVLLALLPAPMARAQALPAAPPPSLADLRADLDAVAADLQGLRAALRVSGAAGYASAGGPDAIARMDRMEAALRRLTGQVEEARNRIETIATDSAARLDEAEFRLCQLEDGCDLGALADGGLGGALDIDLAAGSIHAAPAAAGTAGTGTTAPASADEQARFDAAMALAQAGDQAGAAAAFAAMAEAHAGGPLFAEARFFEGQAQLALGEPRAAARAFTDVFAADPAGPRAPDALLAVARIMAAEGQDRTACQFLAEVMLRHPGTVPATEAAQLHDGLACDADPDLPAGP